MPNAALNIRVKCAWSAKPATRIFNVTMGVLLAASVVLLVS
jgi:hypothetical protein